MPIGNPFRNPFEQYPKQNIYCKSCGATEIIVGVLPKLPDGWECCKGLWCCPGEKCRKFLKEAKSELARRQKPKPPVDKDER